MPHPNDHGGQWAVTSQRPVGRLDRGRVVIISASIGAGHDGAAAELDRRLRAAGLTVARHDFLELMPAYAGQIVRRVYHDLLTHAPWLYQRIYAGTEETDKPGLMIRALLRTAERRTLRTIRPGTVAVVATYPGASQVLGSLRRQGRLAVPALTYLTDFSVHPLWVAEGIDAHLAAHSIPAAQAGSLRAAQVTVTGPVVNPRFGPASEHDRRVARDRFGLPRRAPLALLVAGSWGVGAIERVVSEIQARDVAVPLVVCGRNQRLVNRLRGNGVEHVFGWVDDMPDLMRAADVLVQNAGGLTSLEAFASGLPVASYRCIPGHGLTNAAALDAADLAVWIRRSADLGPMLTELLTGTRGARQRARGLALFSRDEGPAGAILRIAENLAPAANPSHQLTTPLRAGSASEAAVPMLLPDELALLE